MPIACPNCQKCLMVSASGGEYTCPYCWTYFEVKGHDKVVLTQYVYLDPPPRAKPCGHKEGL